MLSGPGPLLTASSRILCLRSYKLVVRKRVPQNNQIQRENAVTTEVFKKAKAVCASA